MVEIILVSSQTVLRASRLEDASDAGVVRPYETYVCRSLAITLSKLGAQVWILIVVIASIVWDILYIRTSQSNQKSADINQ